MSDPIHERKNEVRYRLDAKWEELNNDPTIDGNGRAIEFSRFFGELNQIDKNRGVEVLDAWILRGDAGRMLDALTVASDHSLHVLAPAVKKRLHEIENALEGADMSAQTTEVANLDYDRWYAKRVLDELMDPEVAEDRRKLHDAYAHLRECRISRDYLVPELFPLFDRLEEHRQLAGRAISQLDINVKRTDLKYDDELKASLENAVMIEDENIADQARGLLDWYLALENFFRVARTVHYT